MWIKKACCVDSYQKGGHSRNIEKVFPIFIDDRSPRTRGADSRFKANLPGRRRTSVVQLGARNAPDHLGGTVGFAKFEFGQDPDDSFLRA
jgi:hypothetical protein